VAVAGNHYQVVQTTPELLAAVVLLLLDMLEHKLKPLAV
jgi:hypothetical protein